MDAALLEALANALGPVMDRQKATRYASGFKHDLSTVSPITSGYSHGPGGRLTFPGVDPIVFNAMMGSNSIISQLPAMPSLYTDPTYYTLTGVTDESGDEKEEVCDDAPVAGLMKACLTHSVFGRYERSTQQLELNRLGQRTDRADPLDLRLVGTPMQDAGIFNAGPMDAMTPADLFTNEVSRKFWERNVALYRLMSRQIWAGNPANNSSGGGYKEMTGLDLLINTGYRDIETGVACPAVDSTVYSFGHTRLDSSGSQIVAALTNLMHQLRFKSERAGLNPVRWVMAMRHTLFYELTAIWPCSYLSYRCATSPGMAAPMQGVIDAQDAVRFRDEMRAGMYLIIDGERIEVLTDDGIPELNGNTGSGFPKGCFESDIYVIPMSVAGRSVTYMEYFQYANPSLQDALGNMILGRIEGAFLTWPRQSNLCVQWQTKVEPRLVMRTPWLAGRLDDVVYCPIEHEQDPFPGDPYFKNGGGTSRNGP
ncbi:MAG: hypothetical protein ACHQX3_01745, partial [Nitrospirales bacterium]